MLRVATILACLLVSELAAADYTTVAPVRPLTMSDPSGLSSVGLEVQFTKWTERPPALGDVDITNLTFDLAAEIKLAPHWLLLLRLPSSYATLDGDPATVNVDCCTLTQGNLTVGGRGLWSSLAGSTRRVVGGEFSVSLPTASDEGDPRVSSNAGAAARQPHDVGRYLPDTTTIRLTALAQFYARRFLVQGEVGLQLYFYDSDRPGDGFEPGLRLALAVGARATHKLAILAELNTLVLEEESVTSLDLGVRYGSRHAFVGARVFLPIDAQQGTFDMLGFGFDVGGRF
jgi:hypothetical protein